MPAFDDRAAIWIRKSDEYPSDHPDYDIMKADGFTILAVREPDEDPKAIATCKSARKAGIFPVLWMVPKHFDDGSREKAITFADRMDKTIGDMQAAGAYVYAYIGDNEQLSLEWHQGFAPYMAAKRTRPHWLSIDPLQGSMWDTTNIYTPYVASGWSIDIQCYNDKMSYFDVKRCVGVVLGTPGVDPSKVRVTLPPTVTESIIGDLRKMWPLGIGIFAPTWGQIVTELPKYGPYIRS